MRFAIDVVFLDREGYAVKIVRDLRAVADRGRSRARTRSSRWRPGASSTSTCWLAIVCSSRRRRPACPRLTRRHVAGSWRQPPANRRAPDERVAFVAWTSVSIALLLALDRRLRETLGVTAGPARWIVTSALFAFYPVFHALNIGQMSILLAVAALGIHRAVERDSAARGCRLVPGAHHQATAGAGGPRVSRRAPVLEADRVHAGGAGACRRTHRGDPGTRHLARLRPPGRTPGTVFCPGNRRSHVEPAWVAEPRAPSRAFPPGQDGAALATPWVRARIGCESTHRATIL